MDESSVISLRMLYSCHIIREDYIRQQLYRFVFSHTTPPLHAIY